MNQKKKVNYRPKKRFGTVLVPLITLTVLTAIIAAAVAGVWQLADPVKYVTPEMVASQTRTKTTQEEPQEPSSSSVQEPTAKEESSAQSQSESVPQADLSNYEVPGGEWVGTDYFDDALFVGDSITEGIKIYDIMSNAKVLSYTGINLDNIFTNEVIKSGESKITIMDAAKAESPGKIYVLMGANSMGYDKETFIKGYGRLVDELKKMHPDATLYVQSILPVTAEYAKNRPEFSNETIDEYNLALRQMAYDKGLPFLNVAAAFKDESGALPTEASPKDGMHFSAQWYRKWFDYLREHTINMTKEE